MEEKETEQQRKPRSDDDLLDLVTFKDKLYIFFVIYWRGVILLVTPLVFLFIVCGERSTELKAAKFKVRSSDGKQSPRVIDFCNNGIIADVYGILQTFFGWQWQWAAYTLVIMAIYWMAECIPLSVTAFLPLIIFPMTGIMDTNTVCKCYINDTVFMFMASMMLAYAIEQSNLHIRLALFVVELIGYSHYRLLFAVSLVTMFISMFITNTAATVMAVPIVFALLKVFEDQGLMRIYDVDESGENVASDLSTCYFCAVTFSATIGGIGTLVGTATNLAFKGLYNKAYPNDPEYLSFPLFSAFSIPLMLILEIGMFVCMIIMYFGFLRPTSLRAQYCKVSQVAVAAARNKVESDREKLGFITVWELWVIFLFIGAILLFFSRSPRIFIGWGDLVETTYNTEPKFVKDSTAAFLIVFLMTLIPNTCEFWRHFTASDPNDGPKKRIGGVLSWYIVDAAMPYSFMFLLGGGFALSDASKKEYTNLNGVTGDILKTLENLPNCLILLILIVVTVFLTNLASNVAVANLLCPIAMQMAYTIGYKPLWYCITCGFCASFCFCLPVGTPGNIVVQSAANIPTGKMIKAGLGPTIVTIIVTWIFLYFWAPIIWPDLITYTKDG